MTYVTLFSIMPLLFPNIRKNWASRIPFWIAVLVYLILIYNRPLFYMDTKVYIEHYKYITPSYLHDFNLLQVEPRSLFEYGFILLILFFKKFNASFRDLSICITFLGIVCNYFFIKTLGEELEKENGEIVFDEDRTYSFLTYSFFLYYFGTFYNLVTIRGWLSISLLMISAILILKRKNILPYLFVFLSFTIQRGAIIGLFPLIFIHIAIARQDKPQKYIKNGNVRFLFWWIILGILLIASFMFQQLFFQKAWQSASNLLKGFYTLPTLSSANQSINRLFLLLGYWVTGGEYVITYKEGRFYKTLRNLYVVTIIFAIIFAGYYNSNRFVDYFYIWTLPLSFYTFLICNEEHRNIAKLFYLVPCALFILGLTREYMNWMIVWS